MGALITGITIQLARAGHPEAMKVADANYPGWREKYSHLTGRWEGNVVIPDPPAFQDEDQEG